MNFLASPRDLPSGGLVPLTIAVELANGSKPGGSTSSECLQQYEKTQDEGPGTHRENFGVVVWTRHSSHAQLRCVSKPADPWPQLLLFAFISLSAVPFCE